ncbi:MAG: hypothetical protein E7653_04325 [Ruminococcaceae bacterium]|nr:hypothetical protein [Oscillospiraceae bacterium]
MYKNKFKMPDDLNRYSKKWAAKRVIPCLLIFFALLALIYLFGDVIVTTKAVGFRVLVYLLLISAPFIIFGVPHKLIDKTYFADVIKVWVETTYVQDRNRVKQSTGYYGGGASGSQTYNTVYMIIKRDDGKEKLVEAYKCRANKHQNLDKFKVGDKIFHLYGTKHFIKLPSDGEQTVQCPVCNTTNNIEHRKCRDCGHTLIK